MIDLALVRRATGTTQVQLAAMLGVGQAHISKIERRNDLLLSTLRAYLVALGATARITITVGDRVYEYDLTDKERR